MGGRWLEGTFWFLVEVESPCGDLGEPKITSREGTRKVTRSMNTWKRWEEKVEMMGVVGHGWKEVLDLGGDGGHHLGEPKTTSGEGARRVNHGVRNIWGGWR